VRGAVYPSIERTVRCRKLRWQCKLPELAYDTGGDVASIQNPLAIDRPRLTIRQPWSFPNSAVLRAISGVRSVVAGVHAPVADRAENHADEQQQAADQIAGMGQAVVARERAGQREHFLIDQVEFP
jgi:hypothetical protein